MSQLGKTKAAAQWLTHPRSSIVADGMVVRQRLDDFGDRKEEKVSYVRSQIDIIGKIFGVFLWAE